MLEVDQIYHLACPASPPHYQYNPIKTIKTSTEGTLNMLGLAKRVQVTRLPNNSPPFSARDVRVCIEPSNVPSRLGCF